MGNIFRNICIWLSVKNTTGHSHRIERVYTLDDLYKPLPGNCWEVIEIDSPNISKEEVFNKLDKLYNHMKTATYYRVFCDETGLSFSCYTKKFGKVRGHMTNSFLFFTFGVERSNVRYDVNYALTHRVHPQFTQWLSENFTPFIKAYNEDKNL